MLSEQVLKDVSKLSPKYQTSSLEVKSVAFSYWGMFTRCAVHAGLYSSEKKSRIFIFISYLSMQTSFGFIYKDFFDQHRLCLSAMHYNENADRLQAVTVNVQPCYSI